MVCKLITTPLMTIGMACFLTACLGPSREPAKSNAELAAAAPLSYEGFVEPLFAQKCTSCHSAGGTPPSLETYDEVVANADTSLATMKGEDPPMPPGALLDDTSVLKFERWIKASTPETDEEAAKASKSGSTGTDSTTSTTSGTTLR